MNTLCELIAEILTMVGKVIAVLLAVIFGVTVKIIYIAFRLGIFAVAVYLVYLLAKWVMGL